MNSFQFTRFARLSLALRAPASGFLEGIDPFEETACWGARLKREIFRGNGAHPRGVANVSRKKT